ncbi:alpha-tocopherol transfer protein-like isoform X1 [Hyposmocoma kahamanoa]|uniref:alpha-tocopherol transfer protein-like isoform X1 n=1 Tax=Hyposmocoma kahamanoa TaxID=1477025 RepID=UPI000E6D9404|nr:alpha-tocopherol transfer protein-like isoform X1 [Hyposmocoma kahamanoa]
MSGGESQEEKQSLVDTMRQWTNSQPHLPKDASDGLLLRFLHSCYYDLEKAKTAAELFFTIRGSSPDLLSNRDPESPAIKKTFSIINRAQLHISGNRNLWIWQLNDPGLDNYDYLQDAKIFILTTDAWLLEDSTLQEADIILMDAKDISLKMLTKFNMSVGRRISRYQEDAMPIRLKEIHLVNVPSIMDKLFAVMKPLMKQEITDMIHFHTSTSSTLFQYLSKEDLPEDFGGTNGKMADHTKDALDLVIKHREKLNSDLWMAVGKKSKNKKEKEKSAEVTTGFRSLAID